MYSKDMRMQVNGKVCCYVKEELQHSVVKIQKIKQKYDIFACVLLRRLEKSTQGQCVRIGRYLQGVWEDGHRH